MLPKLAMTMLLRYLVYCEPILKPWEAILSPVVLAAPIPDGDVSVGSTPQSLYRPEAIGKRIGIVQAIGAEHPGALTMAVHPLLAAQALEGDSLCACSKAVARGSCTCGRSVMGGRSAWSQRAEAVPRAEAVAIAIDALAGRTVSGGAGEVEWSPTGPRAQSWQLGAWQAVQMQPLGQGGRLGSAGERRARPSARSVGMVSETKSREAHSRCGEGSTALLPRSLSVAQMEFLCWAGKCDR